MIKDNIVVKINGLEKTFVSESETLTVIKNLDMSVKQGEKAVIVGESGSGKSTLLNIIGGKLRSVGVGRGRTDRISQFFFGTGVSVSLSFEGFYCA